MGSIPIDSHDLSDTVIVIQHSERVPPAYLTTFFHNNSIKHIIVHTYQNQLLPATHNIYALVILGGPQGAYETQLYPYLHHEINYIRLCHQHSIPVLGLCLGCQLIAVAMGGTAYKTDRYECGYVKQIGTQYVRDDPIFSKLFAPDNTNDTLLMHHSDSYTLPSNIVTLCTTLDNNYNGGFKCNNTYGIQSHPESGIDELQQWKLFATESYHSIGLSADEVMNDAISKKYDAHKTTVLFFDLWWTFVQSCHQTIMVIQ